ncbi:MAG: rod-binding protein [Desulfobacterales bacterium]|nr:rod-binding protein [Desulfobacterales bacterium]MDJ0884652.1 rod-binding protein [Desulfobacterales bacterium]
MRAIANPSSEIGPRQHSVPRTKDRPPIEKHGDDHTRDQKRLNKACAEFEALLVQKLFQTMRASIPKSGLIDGGSAEEIYTAMLDQKVAQDMALQGGLGLSARMKAQIVRYMDDLKVEND